jgi:hypothetical protein
MTEIQASSGSTDPCENFRAQLLERDICCIWTGGSEEVVDAIHIIPFQRSSEVCSLLSYGSTWSTVNFRPFQWIQHIVRGRSHYGEDIANLDHIDDVRNGVVTSIVIHRLFDQRTVAVLKVCHI